jgi:hypothetical protein
MSKTSDMSGATELLCEVGQVLELPMLAFHQGRALLTGGSGWTRFTVARSESYCGQDIETEKRAKAGMAGPVAELALGIDGGNDND